MPVDLGLVIPSGGRPEALRRTLRALAAAGASDYLGQTIVVRRPEDTDTLQVVRAADSASWSIGCVGVAQSTGNPSVARNAGLARVRCGHVLFMDNDIEVPTEFFHELTLSLRRWPTDVLLGRLEICHDDHMVLQTDKRLSWLAHGIDREWPWAFLFSGLFCCPTRSVSRGFLPIFRGWGCEDLELGYWLFSQGHRFVYCPRLQATHMVGEHINSPYRRQRLGLEVDLTPFLDNICRVVLYHHADPAVAQFIARHRLAGIQMRDGERPTVSDLAVNDGGRVLTQALHAFRRRYPDDQLGTQVDSVLAAIRPIPSPAGALKTGRRRLIVWPEGTVDKEIRTETHLRP